MPSTYHDLVTRFRADTTHLERGAGRASAAVGKFQKRSGAASGAVIQLANGISDARFGFAGLANNLEFVVQQMGYVAQQSGGIRGAFKAVGASILGPAGIVAGISLMIAYGPQIVSFFKKWVFGATEASKALEKFNEETKKLSSDEQLLADLRTDRAEKLEEKVRKAEEFASLAERGLAGTVGGQRLLRSIQGLDEEIGKIDAAIASVEARIEEARIAAIESKFGNIGLTAEDVNFQKFQSDIAAVNTLFEEGLIGFDEYIRRLENLSMAFDNTGNKALQAGDVMNRFSGTVAGALANANTVGDNFAKSFGSSILNAIGGFLIAEGVAAIASGKTKVASGFLAGIGLNQIKAGWSEVGIGAALKAGGGALSRSSAGRTSGGGGLGTSSSSAAASTRPVAPQRIQGSEQVIRVVGHIDNQVIRLANQRAEDSYQGLS